MILCALKKCYRVFSLVFALCCSGALLLFIVYVLCRFCGFESFVQRLYRFVPHVLRRLGPAFVKFAQLFATRSDICDKDLLKYIANLQQEKMTFNLEKLMKVLKAEYSQEILSRLEIEGDYCHSASIASVYRVLDKQHDRPLALKVVYKKQKSRYLNSIEMCSLCLKILLSFSPSNKRLRLEEIMKVIRQSAITELNMYLEAAATAELRSNALKCNSKVNFPTIYWEFTTSSILCMEWVNGSTITKNDFNFDRNAENSSFAKHSIDSLMRSLISVFFHQVFYDGFFHADIHQGNIMVNLECREITLVDCGMVGFLSQDDRIALGEIFYFFTKFNYHAVADVHFRAHYVKSSQSRELFSLACRSIAEPIFNQRNEAISITALLKRMYDITSIFDMEVQPQLLLLQKTLLTLDGVVNDVAPHLNMWEILTPWFEEWASKHLTKGAQFKREARRVFRELFGEKWVIFEHHF